MSNYTKTVNFAAKDSLTTGDANKVVKGTEIDTEFNNIATAIATKADSSSGGGTVTSVAISGGTTGITVSGSPITTTGTITLAGTLAVANGGTGSTTLAGAGIVTTTGTQSIAGTKSFTGTTNFVTAAGGASFGQATPNSNYAVFIQPNATSGLGGLVTQNASANIGYQSFTDNTSTALIELNYGTIPSSVAVGGITTNGTVVVYGGTSDYRLKENIAPLANAVTRLKQLSPKNFTWKSNPSLGATEGFIAHEVQAVVPDAVYGEKDMVDANGKAIYQNMDASFLIPMLTAALQEAIARIEALEAA